jgi:chorismate synthase
MSSIFGKLFQVASWGESHGKALGVVIDGCPAGLSLSESDIQPWLDRRRPGQNEFVTPRKESDQAEILSGLFEGKTTGTPISILIPNQDQRSADYGEVAQWYRPSHADLSYDLKYGFRDYRGGGRSSARETAARVAAGAVAAKLLKQHSNTEILAWVSQIGSCEADPKVDITREKIEASLLRCPDLQASATMEALIREARRTKNSLGGVVSFKIINPAIGLGEPVFDRVEALLAYAMLSIPASKGFEIGSGFKGTFMGGAEHNDPVSYLDGQFITTKNDAGGVLGGISIGTEIYGRIAFKPVASLSRDQQTVNRKGEAGVLNVKGRHDPCVLPRAPVIVEAMAALVLADLYLEQRSRKTP